MGDLECFRDRCGIARRGHRLGDRLLVARREHPAADESVLDPAEACRDHDEHSVYSGQVI